MATVLRKRVLRQGVFPHAEGVAFVTPETVGAIRNGVAKMAGYRSPLWMEHPLKGERKNYPVKIGSDLEKQLESDPWFAGWAKPVMVEDGALDCDLEFRNDQIAADFEKSGGMVSPQYGTWEDDDGVKHDVTLHHVALTPRAVDRGQDTSFKPVSPSGKPWFAGEKVFDVALSEVRFSMADTILDSEEMASVLGKLKSGGVEISKESVLTLPRLKRILAAFEGQEDENNVLRIVIDESKPSPITLSTVNDPMAEPANTPAAVSREEFDALKTSFETRLSEADKVNGSLKSQLEAAGDREKAYQAQLNEARRRELTGMVEVALSEGRMSKAIHDKCLESIKLVDIMNPATLGSIETRLSDAKDIPAGTFFSPEQQARVTETSPFPEGFLAPGGRTRISHERADALLKGAD